MEIKLVLRVLTKAFVFVSLSLYFITGFCEQDPVDVLLKTTLNFLKTAPEKAMLPLAQLQRLEATLSEPQRNQYYLHLIDSLAFRGKYSEQVELINSKIDQVKDPEVRARFLYNLSDAYTNLGDYEHALKIMNEGVLLLPKLVGTAAKMNTLQAAVSMFESLHAYDDALIFADRIYTLEDPQLNSVSRCLGLGDKVEIGFFRGDRDFARSYLLDAIRACDAYGSETLVLSIKALAAIDFINFRHEKLDINNGQALLLEFAKTNQTSDYVTQLEEAIARAYLKNSDLQLAERYGVQAYQHAQNSKILQMLEKSSETMAKIKRAQGDMSSALDYYDINLALKKKVLDDQLHKNLAYQRVKFDTQDKANQLTLLEQKNRILSTEKKLEQRNNQNLLMLIALGAILMVILSAWTFKVLRQKNLFRLSSQIDGLTQVSNRAHFVACGMQQFEKTEGSISVILFDMDHFKNINDSFGHAVGDWVLKAVSASVKSLLPKAEMLGRLGGEEFAICLPKLNQLEALALAEQCRAAIAAIDSSPSGFAFPVTASFGVACRGMRGLREFEDTLAAADKALYFSKTEGRNRVSLYQ